MRKTKLFSLVAAALLSATTTWADVAQNGKLGNAFSVSATKKVYFSQGNLRATTTNNGSSWTWSFAENQYDYVGNAKANNAINGNGTVSTNGTVDLFGWSTANTYYGIHNSCYTNTYSGDFRDWGTNPITNGGNTANAWRTLTSSEWDYLLNTRTTASGIRYAKATVDGKAGLILLPDNWNAGFYLLSNTNTADADYSSNVIERYYWRDRLEPVGAVFLPAAGRRENMSNGTVELRNVNTDGYYFSATPSSSLSFVALTFKTKSCSLGNGLQRGAGCSVRLVSETAPTYPTITKLPEARSLTYNGNTQQLYKKGEVKNGYIQYSFGNGSNSWQNAYLQGKDAGTYIVYYRVESKDGYAGYVPSPNMLVITIAKATPTVTAPTAKSLTYNGSTQALVNAGSTTGGTLQYKLGNGSWGTSVPTATAAGTYTVYYKVVGDANYNNVAEQSISVTIAKPASSVTSVPTAKSLTYTGSAQALVNAGTASGGTMQYKLGNGSWSNSIPNATNAGNYTVYYKVVGDATHADHTPSPNTVAVTINKAALTCKADNKSVNYSANPPTYTATYSGWKGSDNTSALSGTLSFACPYAKGSNAGSYTITPSGVTASNYNITFQTGTLTVNKINPTVKAPTAKSLTYNGSAQALVNAGSTTGGTLQYKLGSGSWGTSVPTATAAGNYTVYYKVNGNTNYNAVAEASVSVTINKAALTCTADNKSVTYGDAAPTYTASYSGWKGSDNTSALSGTLSFACSYAAGSNAGSYTITPSGVTASNYNITFQTGTLTVNKINPTVTAPTAKSLTYNGSAQALVNAGSTTGGTLQYKFGDGAWGTAIPTATNADTYTVYYKVVGNGNYNDNAGSSVSVTIGKVTLSITADDKSVTYGDAAPAYTASYSGWKGSDNTSVFTGTLTYACSYAAGSNVGDYTITPSGVSANNYDITFNTGTLTVNKTDVTLTAPTAITGLVYTGAAQTLINAGTVIGGELQYKLDDGAYGTSLPQATVAGMYTIYYKVDGDGNHNDVAETSFTVTIGGPTNQVLTANQDPNRTSDYYSTFYHSAIQYSLPEGTQAYIATLDGDALNLTKIAEAGQVLPADNAVILKASGSSITLTPSDATPVTFDATNNLLGVDAATAAPSNCYVLSGRSSDNSAQGVGFYQFSGTLAAHKAYVVIGGGGSMAPKRLRFVFNNENTATGVENLQSDNVQSTKVIENGVLYIEKNGVRYNAQGQIVK